MNQTNEMIIYRNRTEQAFDQALYDSGFVAWIVPVVGALVAFAAVNIVLNDLLNRFVRPAYADRRKRLIALRIITGLSAAVGATTFFYAAIPLWG